MDKVALSGEQDCWSLLFSLYLSIFSQDSMMIKYCFCNHRKVIKRENREAFLHVLGNSRTILFLLWWVRAPGSPIMSSFLHLRLSSASSGPREHSLQATRVWKALGWVPVFLPFPLACINSRIWYDHRESPGSLKWSCSLCSLMLIWFII